MAAVLDLVIESSFGTVLDRKTMNLQISDCLSRLGFQTTLGFFKLHYYRPSFDTPLPQGEYEPVRSTRGKKTIIDHRESCHKSQRTTQETDQIPTTALRLLISMRETCHDNLSRHRSLDDDGVDVGFWSRFSRSSASVLQIALAESEPGVWIR
jgi:hypothetical protein